MSATRAFVSGISRISSGERPNLQGENSFSPFILSSISNTWILCPCQYRISLLGMSWIGTGRDIWKNAYVKIPFYFSNQITFAFILIIYIRTRCVSFFMPRSVIKLLAYDTNTESAQRIDPILMSKNPIICLSPV